MCAQRAYVSYGFKLDIVCHHKKGGECQLIHV